MTPPIRSGHAMRSSRFFIMPAGQTHPVETDSECKTLRNVPVLLSNGRRLRTIVESSPEGAQAAGRVPPCPARWPHNSHP